MKTPFDGIYAAQLTPFKADGSIDEKPLRQLIEMNIRKGITGFYVGGSTAEAFLLTTEQRKQLFEIVADQTAGRAKLIAHVGTINQNTAVELAKHAAANGADAVSSIPPFYYGFPFDCIKKYYFALADATDKPVLIYHFPANSGVNMTVDHVAQFLQDKRFLGVKFTSNDLFMLSRIKELREDAVIFNGYDEIFLSGIMAGANGGVGSTYNFMAEKYLNILKLVEENRIAEAQKVQMEIVRIIDALCKVGVMPGEKAILTMMGIPMGQCLPPFQQLGEAEYAYLRKVCNENGIQF